MSITLQAAEQLEREIASTQQDICALREGMARYLISQLQTVYQRLLVAIDDGEKLRAERKIITQQEEPIPQELIVIDQKISQLFSKIVLLQQEVQSFSYQLKKNEVREELLKLRGDFERFMHHTHTIRYRPKDLIHNVTVAEEILQTQGPVMFDYTRDQHIKGRGIVPISMWPKEINPSEFEI